MGSNTATTLSSVAPATVRRRQRMGTPRPTQRHTSGSTHGAGPTDPNGAVERAPLEILMSIAAHTRHLLRTQAALDRHERAETLLARAKAAVPLAPAGRIGLLVLCCA